LRLDFVRLDESRAEGAALVEQHLAVSHATPDKDILPDELTLDMHEAEHLAEGCADRTKRQKANNRV